MSDSTPFVVFDIETIADLDRAKELLPAFDPSTVKTGNLGPDKAAEKVAEAKAAAERDWFDQSALFAERAKVAMIGWYDGKEFVLNHLRNDPEPVLLAKWWAQCKANIYGQFRQPMLSFYGNSFDLPFLIRRSWITRVSVTDAVWGWKRRGFADSFVDLYDVWRCGVYNAPGTGGLNGLCKILGVPGKSGTGNEFGKLWESGKINKCMDYLKQDLKSTYDCAVAMGGGSLYREPYTKGGA